MTKPVLNLTGDPRDRGRAHGEILSKEIDENLERYLKRFQILGFEKDALMAESARWAEALRPKDPIFWDEIDGVVEGSGRSLEEITLLNVRYELLVGMMKSDAQAQFQPAALDACTSFAVLPERSKTGDTVIGQNWDWVKDINTVVSRVSSRRRTGLHPHRRDGHHRRAAGGQRARYRRGHQRAADARRRHQERVREALPNAECGTS